MILEKFLMSLFKNHCKDEKDVLQDNHNKMVDYLRNKFQICQEDAEDAVQNAILVLLEKKEQESLEKMENIAAYTYAILKNECFKIIRHAHRMSYSFEEKLGSYSISDPFIEIDNAEKIKMLLGCLSNMTESNKAFFLFIYENPDKSVDEVATYFGIKKSNVYTRRHRLQKIVSKCILKKINYKHKKYHNSNHER
jgi:RNA polymerase sigma factor (sigma-70 family)